MFSSPSPGAAGFWSTGLTESNTASWCAMFRPDAADVPARGEPETRMNVALRSNAHVRADLRAAHSPSDRAPCAALTRRYTGALGYPWREVSVAGLGQVDRVDMPLPVCRGNSTGPGSHSAGTRT